MSKKSSHKSKDVKRRVMRRSPMNGNPAGGRESRDWFVNILVDWSGEPTDQFLELFEAQLTDDELNLSEMVRQTDSSTTADRLERVVRVHSGPELVSIAGGMFLQIRVLAGTNCAEELAALTGAIDGLSFRVMEGDLTVDAKVSDDIVYESGRRVVGAVAC